MNANATSAGDVARDAGGASTTLADRAAWQTMRDLDTRAGRVKGTAFRAFKRRVANLREGTDFIVMNGADDDALAAPLRAAKRIYRGSVHPVLLAPAAAREIFDTINTHACAER